MLNTGSAGEQQPIRPCATDLNVLVVGATGGTGRAVVENLLRQGHRVSAFSRGAGQLAITSDRLTCINGDVTRQSCVDDAVRGHDAVIVTLGIQENPLRVRFFGPAGTAANVRSIGTRNVVAALRKHGVRRLVVQSSYGVGETRNFLRRVDRLFFKLILKPQIADTEAQEQVVRSSGVDWIIAQPVHLTDDDSANAPFVSPTGQARLMKVSRKSVAQFLARAVSDSTYLGKSVAVSG